MNILLINLQERSSEENVDAKRRRELPEESTKETEVKVLSQIFFPLLHIISLTAPWHCICLGEETCGESGQERGG